MQAFQSFKDTAATFSMGSPFASLPEMPFSSDILTTKLSGMGNVWDIMKNRKPIMQSFYLLFSNILLDMIESALELEPQTISDQLMEVVRIQIQDAIQRTSFQ